MPPSEQQQRCVMFVCGERGDGSVTPKGTAFLIAVTASNGAISKYFITAAHNVRGIGKRWIRLRRRDGGSSKDFIISEWRYHPTADIAAAVCDWDTNEYVANWQEVEYFSDVYPAGMPIKVGHPVFFMGLLGHVDSLSDHVIPMIRGGKRSGVGRKRPGE